jgi:hypothetical protein
VSAQSAAVDRHRQAVYDLEDVAFGGTIHDEPMPFAEAADLVRSFCAEGWWVARGLPVPDVLPTRVDSSRSYARCDGGDPSIHLSPAGCTVATIAHELAHVVARRTGADDEPDHGPAFRRWDVALAEALMGPAGADRLAAAFATAGLVPGPEGDTAALPRSTTGGYWTTWRSARALAAAAPSGRGPIAL